MRFKSFLMMELLKLYLTSVGKKSVYEPNWSFLSLPYYVTLKTSSRCYSVAFLLYDQYMMKYSLYRIFNLFFDIFSTLEIVVRTALVQQTLRRIFESRVSSYSGWRWRLRHCQRHQHFSCCCSLWFSSASKKAPRINSTQNRAQRTMLAEVRTKKKHRLRSKVFTVNRKNFVPKNT